MMIDAAAVRYNCQQFAWLAPTSDHLSVISDEWFHPQDPLIHMFPYLNKEFQNVHFLMCMGLPKETMIVASDISILAIINYICLFLPSFLYKIKKKWNFKGWSMFFNALYHSSHFAQFEYNEFFAYKI